MKMISKLLNAFRGDSGSTFVTSGNTETATPRTDGFSNFISKLGYKDRMTGYTYEAGLILDPDTLTLMYRTSGISRKIVDLIPKEMTREWFTVNGDPEGLIIAKLEEMNAKIQIRNLIRWSRLFGGAIAVMGIDDGNEFDMPLNEKNIKSVQFLHIFDRHEVTWEPTQIYKDLKEKKFGQPIMYRIQPSDGRSSFNVHESRVLKLCGDPLPNRALATNLYWSDSALQITYDEIKNLSASNSATANIIQDFIQTIVKMPNLINMIARGDENTVLRRLDILDQSRSVANTVLIDAGEEYQKVASAVSGLDQLLVKFGLMICCVNSIPYTLMFGESPGGLQATGDSDIRLFYDRIKSDQEDYLQPILERLIRLIMISQNGPFKGKEPENWQIEFQPLWQMTDMETATYRKTNAETDQIYINSGVIDPAEVAESRFGGDMYSAETHIDMEGREDPVIPSEEKKAYEAEKETAKKQAQGAGVE